MTARVAVALLLVALAACGTVAVAPDAAPDPGRPRVASFKSAVSYHEALRTWRSPEDMNAWIGARFDYDLARALRLSESERGRSGPLRIHEPAEFFSRPSGICVDLARFAVETLREIAPEVTARYLMIEFAPVTTAGNTLRLHWVAAFVRDGRYHVLADSKRPGHLAGPYASARAFVDEYATFRGRPVVAFRELDSYQRRQRTPAPGLLREERRP